MEAEYRNYASCVRFTFRVGRREEAADHTCVSYVRFRLRCGSSEETEDLTHASCLKFLFWCGNRGVSEVRAVREISLPVWKPRIGSSLRA